MKAKRCKYVAALAVAAAVACLSVTLVMYLQCTEHDDLVIELERRGFWVQRDDDQCTIIRVDYLEETKPLDLRGSDIIQRILSIPTLQSLHLQRIWIWEDDVASVAPMLDLTLLDFAFSSIGDRQLAHFRDCPIVDLDLMGTEITDDSSAVIGSFEDLEQLIIAQTKTTDAFLCDLPRLSRLKVLDISETGVTNKGIACLSQMPAIERLYVSDTLVDDGIWPVLTKLPRLKQVEIFGTTISPVGTAEFAAQRPDVHLRVPRDIEWYIRENMDRERTRQEQQ